MSARTTRVPALRFAVPILMVLAGLLLGGCAFPYRDGGPKTQFPPERIQLAEQIRLARDGWPEARWWERFNDPRLNALMEQALAEAPALDIVRVRTEAARAKVEAAQTAAGPLVSAMGMINRMHVSDAGFLGVYAENIPVLGINGPWYTTATVGLTGSWSLDLWGKHRAAIRAAVGAANAQLAEQAQAELMLAGGLAKIYFDIQALYGLVDLLEQSRAIEAEAVEAHKERHARGMEPLSAHAEARLRMLALAEQVINAKNDARSLHEALRALVGRPDLPPLEKSPLPTALGRMPSYLGYGLIARRPDLQAARWYVQSSLDAVDAVKAAFYPDFNILGFFGYDSMDYTSLFRHGAQQIMLTPTVSLPLFDSGRLRAALRETRAASNETIALYNEAVLNAVKDVAQAGIHMQKVEARIDIQKERLQAASFLRESAEAYHGRGLTDRITSAEARLPLLLEQAKDLELRRLHLTGEISLIQALGGGYLHITGPKDKEKLQE